MELDTLELSLKRVDSPLTAVELHGLLTGMLSASYAVSFEKVLGEILDEEQDPADVLVKEAIRNLKTLFDEMKPELNDPEMAFTLMLPDEDAPLPGRLQALGQWCQGFVYGIGRGGVTTAALKGDSAELLKDFAEISRISEEAEGGEDDEEAYMELVEYIRVGVMLINEELQPFRAPPVMQ
jgi:yecA family protein